MLPVDKDKFFEEVVESISKVENGCLRATLFGFLDLAKNLTEKEAEIENRLKDLIENDLKIKRLQTISGIGLMTSTAMVSVIDDISRFKKASEFGSYVGLVPGEKSS
jgi:transposase